VNWRESTNPHNLLDGPIVFRVRTLRVGPRGWSVDGSVANHTGQALRIVYAHESAGHNMFGLYIIETGGFTIATRSRPRVPTVLLPGETWAGTFSGPDVVASGVRLHVQFGQFGDNQAHRWGFVTYHSYVVR
jgi:hypothetical protein